MAHFFALLLWAAAGLAYLGGLPQLTVAIVIVVLVNGVFAFVQEYRADRAGRKLRELLPARIIVRRDGHRQEVNAADLVMGDVVLLAAGDRISADLELLDVHGLALDESMLTGESAPSTLGRAGGPGGLISRSLIGRVFGVLGLAEAAVEMSAFIAVLLAGGWSWGRTPSTALLATASGTAFTTVVLGQMATAFACRSETRWVGRLDWRGNPLLLSAVAVEIAVLFIFIGVPALARLLGGSFPSALGWLVAVTVIPGVFLADAAQKAIRARRRSQVSARLECRSGRMSRS